MRFQKILYFQVEWLITHSTVFAWSLQTASPKRPQLSSQWLFSCVWTPWRPHCFEWWPHRDWNSRFYFQPLSNSCIDDCLFWCMGPDPTAPRITQPRVYFCAFTILLAIACVDYLSYGVNVKTENGYLRYNINCYKEKQLSCDKTEFSIIMLLAVLPLLHILKTHCGMKQDHHAWVTQVTTMSALCQQPAS